MCITLCLHDERILDVRSQLYFISVVKADYMGNSRQARLVVILFF